MDKFLSFENLIGSSSKSDEELKQLHRKSKIEPVGTYSNNFTENEIDMFIKLLDHSELFTESDKDGNVKTVPLIKVSKDVLDGITDNRWSKFSKEEKKAFLNNYKWNGIKFVPTVTGMAKAATMGAVDQVFQALTPLSLAKRISISLGTSIITGKLSGKAFSPKIIIDVLRSLPKGLTIGTLLAAITTATITAISTTPNEEKDPNKKLMSYIRKDWASKFDANVKNTKDITKLLYNKLWGKSKTHNNSEKN